MAWKKHLTIVPTVINDHIAHGSGASSAKYSSYLPEVYAGHPNRLQRYYQYDSMDRDSDISAALDTIADFSTQSEEQTDRPLNLNFTDDITETEVTLLHRSMEKWLRLNDFRSRLWYIFRETIKNGDSFFIRDPETQEWHWIDHYCVESVRVKENGKDPAAYMVRGLEPHLYDKFAALRPDGAQFQSAMGTSNRTGTRPMSHGSTPQTGGPYNLGAGGGTAAGQTRGGQGHGDMVEVDASYVIHLSLNAGMDPNWPFGASVLEPVFKTFKQKELLEDSIIIYRVQRAPERRIFYIDVGDNNNTKARQMLEQIKTEIHQRRIPNQNGGGSSLLDAAYNPLSIVEDYFFAQSAEGRGSKVETLPGGDNLGEITDLSFFTKKLARGLRIPESYLNMGGEGGGAAAYADGRLGQAMVEEYRFSKYCIRLQSLLAPDFDREFKRFLRESGISIDQSSFHLGFCPPQNFAKYRQIEVDQAQVSVYQQVEGNGKLSERFKMKRFLNLTEDEIIENERMWAEENAEKVKNASGASPAEEDDDNLSAVGIRSGDGGFGEFDFDDDMGDMEGGDMGDMGDMGGDMGGGEPSAPPVPDGQ